MARNYAETTEKQVEQLKGLVRAHTWRAAGAWSISLLLMACEWSFSRVQFATRFHHAPLAVGFFSLQAALTVFLQAGLDGMFSLISIKQRYRLAFGISAAWGLTILAYHGLVSPTWQRPSGAALWLVLVVWVVWGAFLGAIIATALKEPLWEDNLPPTEQVKKEVHYRHLEIIGQPPPAPIGKRGFDLLVSGVGLLVSMPVWTTIAFLIWFEDPGPILFVKNSVGKGGLNFHQFKFRTMVCGAEQNTGPVLSQKGDYRVLLIGRLLRKTALDELPQLLNILKAEMSLVGPRPQRTVLVRDYLQAIPEYAFRHAVLPGLSGLAQVAGDYYLTPLQKLRFDRLYIRNRGLAFDLKLLALAFLITFWFRWQKGWKGRLPRACLHGGLRWRGNSSREGTAHV